MWALGLPLADEEAEESSCGIRFPNGLGPFALSVCYSICVSVSCNLSSTLGTDMAHTSWGCMRPATPQPADTLICYARRALQASTTGCFTLSCIAHDRLRPKMACWSQCGRKQEPDMIVQRLTDLFDTLGVAAGKATLGFAHVPILFEILHRRNRICSKMWCAPQIKVTLLNYSTSSVRVHMNFSR